MKKQTIIGLGLSALLLGGATVGVSGIGGAAFASGRDTAKEAAANAARATKSLTQGNPVRAVAYAETAVALNPADVAYRALLGQSYLKAGRFTSAHQAYADVLSLDPGNGKAALNLALAQIAEGQWDDARKTLDAHAETIPAADRGLAIALAGDPATGVEVLMVAARTPDADAKTRQNLALALALSGRWKDATTLVAVDVSPAETNARIMQWISFAKPVSASDQVAALLGVVPVKDPGQPVTLALSAPAPVMAAAAEPVEAFMPGQAPLDMAAAAPVEIPMAPVAATPVAVAFSGVRFGERREIVQALPVSRVATIASTGAFKTKATPDMVASERQIAKGSYYVQLGAFDNAGVAKDAWGRAKRRFAALSVHAPAGVAFRLGGAQYYRLSVGGFARGDADAMCRSYRAKGGACFVRAGAGDQMAAWLKPSAVQLAAR